MTNFSCQGKETLFEQLIFTPKHNIGSFVVLAVLAKGSTVTVTVMFKKQKTRTAFLSSYSRKHEWKFGRTRNAVGERAVASVSTSAFSSSPKRSRLLNDRVVFTLVSDGIRICSGFVLPYYVIGLKISRHLVIQSEVKPKPIETRSLEFFPRFASTTCICFEL